MVRQAHHSVAHGEGDLHEGADVLELLGQVCQMTGYPLGVAVVSSLAEMVEGPLQFLLVGHNAQHQVETADLVDVFQDGRAGRERIRCRRASNLRRSPRKQ